MEKLTEAQVTHLNHMASEGALVREWMNHPAAKIVERELDKLTGRAGDRWLTLSEEDAAKLRREASGYKKVWEVVKKLIIEGDTARTAVKRDSESF